MSDRIIQLTSIAAAGGADRQLAEDAVMWYLKRGAADTEVYLVKGRSVPPAQAADLITRIDTESHRLNRSDLVFNIVGITIGTFALILLLMLMQPSVLLLLLLIIGYRVGLPSLPKRLKKLKEPRYQPTVIKELP